MMRLCVIGLGSWGSRVAERARDLDGMRVVSVCDTDAVTLDTVAARVGANAHTSWHYAIDDCDAVIIATPPGDKRDQLVKDVISAGINHVRVEKPLTRSWDAALDLVEFAAGEEAKLVVGHTAVYQPAVSSLVNLFGDLTTAHVALPIQFERLCSRAPAHAETTSPVWDLMVHDIALHQVLFKDQWAMGAPTVLAAGSTADGKYVAQIGNSVFIASWNHPSTHRGIRSDLLTYNEETQYITCSGKGFQAPREFDALGLELSAWMNGGGFPARNAAHVVHVAEQVERILVANGVQHD